MPTTNERILNEALQREVELERYKRGLVLRMFDLLTRMEEDIVTQMGRLDPAAVGVSYRSARLTRMLAAVVERVNQYGAALEQTILPELEELARDEAAFGVQQLTQIPPVALDVVTPTRATIVAAARSRPFQGRLLREWVADHPAAVRLRLRGAIRQGIAQGEDIPTIVRRIKGTAANKYSDGIMEVNRRGATAMVRTAVNHVTNAARAVTYEENADIIKGVRWVATLDGRTSQTCVSLDGRVFPLNSGPRPPAHINCRSSTVPVLKSWKELGIPLQEAPAGTRASMDGQVAGNLTYADWLKGRTKPFQDDVLGKTRADLWRSGAIPMDKFVDYSGRVLTLEQLRKKVPKAFA